jgi:hypothetical protein
MKNPEILIYDDELSAVNRYRHKLLGLPVVAKHFDVGEAITTKELQDALRVLEERQRAIRAGKNVDYEPRCRLDDAAIFIVDYDLLKASGGGASLVGEAVAYLARCFSRCGVIVGLNQFGENTFDLTLRGHPESFADLNIGSKQIDNENLWGNVVAGFHPSYWPSLPKLVGDFRLRLADVRKHLDRPVLASIGFDDEITTTLPRTVLEFLGSNPLATTFRKFALKSDNGLRRKDNKAEDEEVIARVAAARISKWLERIVLPGQDILVSAPHLVFRFPSLLNGDSRKLKDWQRFAAKSDTFSPSPLETYRPAKCFWFSRHVWFWPKVCKFEDIQEIREPWKAPRLEFALAEDTSSFHKKDQCREFVAETESPFNRRYIKKLAGIDYRPAVRLSL